MITGKLYDRLKYLAQIVLPALGTLYFTLAGIWDLGSGEEVVGTIMAFDLFLGVLLGISQNNYKNAIADAGDVVVDKDGKVLFQLDSDKTDLDTLGEKEEIRFKVKKETGGDIS